MPREMRYAAGDEVCRRRRDVPRETRCTAGDGSEVEGTSEGEGSGVKQSGVRGFPLQQSALELREAGTCSSSSWSWHSAHGSPAPDGVSCPSFLQRRPEQPSGIWRVRFVQIQGFPSERHLVLSVQRRKVGRPCNFLERRRG